MHTPGEYEVRVVFQGQGPRDVVFAVGTPDRGGPLLIDAEGRETPARIVLSAGPVVLRLELESTGNPESAAQARMGSIVLRRR